MILLYRFKFFLALNVLSLCTCIIFIVYLSFKINRKCIGIKNILCITGDSVKAGDQQDAKAVHEFESVKLLQQIQDFNKGIDPTLGELTDKKTFIFSGAAADPGCRNKKSLKNRIREKKEAGAQFIQTQMVMGKENLIEFCEEISKPLEIPVIAGVFLLKSYKNALFINKYVLGQTFLRIF